MRVSATLPWKKAENFVLFSTLSFAGPVIALADQVRILTAEAVDRLPWCNAGLAREAVIAEMPVVGETVDDAL
jgi:hypothetical protein